MGVGRGLNRDRRGIRLNPGIGVESRRRSGLHHNRRWSRFGLRLTTGVGAGVG
jgi:hypothetical protein